MCYFKDKLTFGYFNGIEDPGNNNDPVFYYLAEENENNSENECWMGMFKMYF